MFGYAGNSNEELNFLYSALVESSRNDVIGSKYGYSSHSDGYGIVVYNQNNLFHFRSSNPIYEEKVVLPPFSGKIYAIFHSMNAHNKNLISPIFEHPFTSSNGKEVIYMAHNGVVDKKRVMEDLQIVGTYNDTEAALQYIIENGIEAVNELEKYTKSSLNLILLVLHKDHRKQDMYFKNFYKDHNRKDYLDMYTIAMPHGRAVVSSTLTKYGVKDPVPVTGSMLMNIEGD
jgi:glutamine amidotransferase